MEYPATQMFVNDDDDEEDEEEETDGDAGTPLRTEKNTKVGVLLVDSSIYPIRRGINRIGRIDSCGIVIDHNTISKEHAEIEAGVGSKSTFISDLGSLNKTKLNDAILRPGRLYQLQDGDVVRFGSVKAVFKVEENKPENPSVRSSDCGDFIIPETPGPIASKNRHPVVPGTPDVSFDGSLTDGNRSSDVSVIAGTQEVENISGKTSSRLSTEPLSVRESGNDQNFGPDGDETRKIGNAEDISDLETQQNISIEDSDEEDIFDMMTQQTDNHDDGMQRSSSDNLPAPSNVDKTESNSQSIEDLETQKFLSDHDGTESRSKSINDLETQIFSVPDLDRGSQRPVDGNSSRSYSINDLETQKFPIGDITRGSRRAIDVTESCFGAINDLETQKIPIDGDIQGSCRDSDVTESPPEAINDLKTQKVPVNDDEDSETDEEGIFAGNVTDDEIIDVFDAPTQLIRAPCEVSQSPHEKLKNRGDAEVQKKEPGIPREEEIIQRDIPGSEKNEEQICHSPSTNSAKVERKSDSVKVETSRTKVMEINEEKRSTLNDSIESKLNHMFDDVNETVVEEPTQMLTQHLENILKSTQIDRTDFHRGSEDKLKSENVDIQLPKNSNHGDAKIDCLSSDTDNNDHDGDVAKSDDENTNKSVKGPLGDPINADIQGLKILSTQELFEDLPFVNFSRTPTRNSVRGRIKVSPSLDVESTPRSKKSKRFELDNAKKVNDTEASKLQTDRNNTKNQSNGIKHAGPNEVNVSVDSKRSKTTKNIDLKADQSRFAPIEEIQVLPKSDGCRKPRIQKESVVSASSARNLEKASAKVKAPMNAVSRKKLPLKKRGSSVASDPPTPRKMEAEVVVSSARIGTRSIGKMSIEMEKKSTVDSPKDPDLKHATSTSTRVNHNKRESPKRVLPAGTEPSNRNKKGARSSTANDASSTTNSNFQAESKPQEISSPGRRARRAQKKPLDTLISDEEAISPVKRPKISTSTLPSTVKNRSRLASQREKRENAKARELNVSELRDAGIDQNNSLMTRSRRGRPPIITSSNDSSRNSSLTMESLENATQQPSLESQEIQAILGVVDEGDNKAPRSRRERRGFQNHDSSNDAEKDREDRTTTRQGFRGFSRTDKFKEDVEDKFEKPVGIPDRKKRQLRQTTQLAARENDDDNDEHSTETNKTRPKPRGRRNLDVSKNNLANDEPSDDASVAVESSNVKSSRKLTDKDKMHTEKIKSQNSPSAIVIIAKESTPKSKTTTSIRNKRGISRGVVDLGEKENVVEEPPVKRGRKKNVEINKREKSSSTDDEFEGSRQSSSPLRRGRSSLATPTSLASSLAKTKHKILFTGLNDPHLVSIVQNLGGNVTEKPNDCTALVTDKVRRTYKFLCAMAMAVPIVSVEWLKESERKGRFLETGDFLLKDPAEEAKFKFNLRRSLAMATHDKLLEGYTVVLTPNTAPPPNAEMKSIIQACGGKVLVRPPTKWPEKSLIISRQEDVKNAKKFVTKAPKSVHLLSVEFILTGILRQELNFQEHKLEIE